MAAKVSARYIRVAFCLLTLLLAGCSGGSSGGGGSTGLAFSGNTDPAAITATNAATVVADVEGTQELTSFTTVSAQDSGASSAQSTGIIDLAQRLSRDIQRTLTSSSTTRG